MIVKEVTDKKEKQRIARSVLEALTEWFEVEETREAYITGSADLVTIAAFDNEKPVGFMCLKETGKDTVEIAVMGVLKEYHRHGVGRELFNASKDIATKKGYSFMQVKTVKMGVYEDYDRTNRFYLGVGFKEFEIIPMFWDEANPCQIYVMSLK